MRTPGISKTKIIATIGPASSSPEVLAQLIETGVSVFRLNFSHGTHDAHSDVLSRIRTLSRNMDRHVAILQDLCGPKIRLGPIPGDVVDCKLGDEFTLVSKPSQDPDSGRELTCSYEGLADDVKRGETILFADGNVAMIVTESASGRARMRVTLPGRLRSRQGLNLPGTELAVSSLTDKDLRDLDWTAAHADDVDFVGLSFVRGPHDVVRLREELKARRCRSRIVAKIEKPQAVQRVEEIIATTDAVMVARGDLGVEMDVQRVPSIQKRIIALCNEAHRPVITATQMLNSMEHSSRPTRAEASDVFNAVLDGTDAVMLSGETAVGEFPIEAVRTMACICAEAEAHEKVASRGLEPRRSAPLSSLVDSVTEAAVDGACLMAEQLRATLIVVAAESGRSALALSNRRPIAPVLALTHSEEIARVLSLCWGVTALILPGTPAAERVLTFGVDWATSRGLVRPGDHAILLRGDVVNQSDTVSVIAGTIA